MEIKKGNEFEVLVEKMSFGGRAIAKVDSYVIFIKNAMPLDRAIIKITKKKKSFAEAYVVKIVEPSPYRIEPYCSYSGYCGGCKWQFIKYEKQLEYKKNSVKELLEKVALIENPPVLDTIPSPEIFHYRNKMEFTISSRKWLMPNELIDKTITKDFGIGFHLPKAYNKIIDIKSCKLQQVLGDDILEDIREFIKETNAPIYENKTHSGFWRFVMLRYSNFYDEWMVNIVTKDENFELLEKLSEKLVAKYKNIISIVNNINNKRALITIGEKEKIIFGKSFLKEKLENYEFEISANSFFQTNTNGAIKLYQKIREIADLKGDETIIDLYSGTGTIPIFLSQYAKEIFGIEIVSSAVKNAEKSVLQNEVKNCKFILGDIQYVLPTLTVKPDLIIADPPRAGMHKSVIKTIIDIAPEKIIYVSCNPATLARDISLLKEKYEMVFAQPFDMFPHTHHIETIVKLRLLNKIEG